MKWGSAQAITWVWQQQDMRPGEKLVALVLADGVSDWRDMATLTRHTGMDQDEVTEALRGLGVRLAYLMEMRWGVIV